MKGNLKLIISAKKQHWLICMVLMNIRARCALVMPSIYGWPSAWYCYGRSCHYYWLVVCSASVHFCTAILPNGAWHYSVYVNWLGPRQVTTQELETIKSRARFF